MNKLDFQDWKRHPVTQVVFSQLEDRVKFLVEQLIDQAAEASPEKTAERAGAIKAFRELLGIEYEGEDS